MTENNDLTIVGIGSSCGAGEALRHMVASLTSEAAVSYVLLHHPSPQDQDVLTSLSACKTKFSVRGIRDGQAPERDVIHVAPTGADVVLVDGKLTLVAPSAETTDLTPSIDRFLISLAKDRCERSIGVILSGTGSDGVRGLQAVHKAGGITLAQKPDCASCSELPSSAIKAGCVDLILEPAEIGRRLAAILSCGERAELPSNTTDREDASVEMDDGKEVMTVSALEESPSNTSELQVATSTERAALETAVGARPLSTDRQFVNALVSSLGDNAILVADDHSIAHVFGEVSPFMSAPAAGQVAAHIDHLQAPLREEARSLVEKALQRGKRQSAAALVPAAENTQNAVQIDVYPILADAFGGGAALIVFTPAAIKPSNIWRDIGHDSAPVQEHISDLESQLRTTRDALEETIEELETSNEELQTINQELQWTNEELETVNKDLEVSNDQLQSANCKLISVNEEFMVTTSELARRTGELESVLRSSPLPILVTNTSLQVTQATESAAKLFGLSLPTSNPHISECQLPDGFPSLSRACSDAMQLRETVSHDFTHDGSRVILNCAPYFNTSGEIAGVTLVTTYFPGLVDEMEMILETENVLMMHRGLDGEILRVSVASARLMGVTPQACVGRNIREFLQADDAEALIRADNEFVASEESSNAAIYRLKVRHTGEIKCLSMRRFPFRNIATGEKTVYAVSADVTDILLAREQAETAVQQIELLQEIAGIGYWLVDLEKDQVHWSSEVHRIHRTDPKKYRPTLDDGLNFYHPDDKMSVVKTVENTVRIGSEFSFVKRLVAANGEEVRVNSHGVAITNAEGETVRIIGVFQELVS